VSTRKSQNYGGVGKTRILGKAGRVSTRNPKTTEEAGKLGLRIRREGCPRANLKTTEEAGKTTGPNGKGVHIQVRWCYGNILLGREYDHCGEREGCPLSKQLCQ